MSANHTVRTVSHLERLHNTPHHDALASIYGGNGLRGAALALLRWAFVCQQDR